MFWFGCVGKRRCLEESCLSINVIIYSVPSRFVDDWFGFCPSKWVSGPRGYSIRLSDLHILTAQMEKEEQVTK